MLLLWCHFIYFTPDRLGGADLCCLPWFRPMGKHNHALLNFSYELNQLPILTASRTVGWHLSFHWEYLLTKGTQAGKTIPIPIPFTTHAVDKWLPTFKTSLSFLPWRFTWVLKPPSNSLMSVTFNLFPRSFGLTKSCYICLHVLQTTASICLTLSLCPLDFFFTYKSDLHDGCPSHAE